VDLSAPAVEHAVATLKVKACQGSIEQHLRDWRGRFDLVTVWATLEHVRSPLATLLAVHDCLKPGGVLLLDTGLGHAPFEGLLPGYSQWYDAPQHLFIFSAQGVQRLLADAGFATVRVDCNFERSTLRRCARWLFHAGICCGTGILLRPLLGPQRYRKMREEAKWPIGRLLSLVARKR
jgi:SAM-dependent methyltransferase